MPHPSPSALHPNPPPSNLLIQRPFVRTGHRERGQSPLPLVVPHWDRLPPPAPWWPNLPLVGTWIFTHSIAIETLNIVKGCYRPQSFLWYLQPLPFWTSFIIIPVFFTLSSLANLQPFKSKQLPIMVVISCASYASI
ncbi:hypothetical protein E4T56_gene15765 [Termitomyces sp. T112]|nr:hypothetical protein E4T56_gene15765 [Termitomyces sp. T112]